MRTISLGFLVAAAAAFSAQARPPKVLLIALDGASENVVTVLSRQGRIPRLTKLFNAGWYAPIHTGLGPSPAKWTTVFSGLPTEVHGVTDFNINGEGLSSAHCRAARVWDILGARGYSVAVLCPLATTPVQSVNGVMLADRWRPFMRAATEHILHPPELLPVLETAFEKNLRRLKTDPATRAGFEEEKLASRDIASIQRSTASDAEKRSRADRVLAHWRLGDLAAKDFLLALLKRKPFDFAVFYTHGIDIVSHLRWNAADEDAGADVAAYYVHVDRILGDLIDAFPRGSYVIVMSDHGFQANASPHPLAFTGGHSKLGIFCLAGPGVPARRDDMPIDGLAVTPTVLDIFGVPASEEMPGRPLLERNPGVARVPSYPRPPPRAEPVPYGPGERQLLKDLGYLR